ncbi:hypothetical protein HBI95_090270 [Parastagonospora nodorum]|nr:hypothetical protein HBI95_090270 [Parastagonospora nodorum]KAH6208037.1 hypothetical protein HBI43_179040 [Parastagonospora nodorum]KAH6247225.1 hypothetical protein HBI42_184020 [Parastagonospora nodorum]
MCLKVVHKYGCGHETAATAPCATSRTSPCGVNNVKTVKHEEKCEQSPTRASLVHHTPHDGPQHSAGAPSCPCNASGYPTKPCPPRRNKLPLSQRL